MERHPKLSNPVGAAAQPVGAVLRTAQDAAQPVGADAQPVGAVLRTAQDAAQPVGAVLRTAQKEVSISTAGVVQARLWCSSQNCTHTAAAQPQNCTHTAAAQPQNCTHTAAAQPVGAVLRTAPPPPPAFFSPHGNVRIWHGNLPHWQQAGVATFVTLRAAGSLPRSRLDELRAFDDAWRAANIDPSNDELRGYVQRRREMVEKWLDAGDGPCPFSSVAARQAVEQALWSADGNRFRLYAFVVMPNHVHLLICPTDAFVEKALASFKRFAASAVNRINGARGAVWQREHYDTLIRDAAHFRRVRDYIWNNCPEKAWDCYRACDVGSAVRRTAPTGLCDGGCSSENCTKGWGE